MPTKLFSCVVDETPALKAQTLSWLYSLIGSGAATREEIVVHVVEEVSQAFRRAVEAFGVQVRQIRRFGRGPAVYCNKIAQLDALAEQSADYFVLCDADLAFVADITPWLTGDSVRASVVGRSNPPLRLLEELYAATGLTRVPPLVPTVIRDGLTFATNCNGGLYIVPRRWLATLAEAWPRWSRFVLNQPKIVGRYMIHADQLGFCFAALEQGLPLEHLPLSLNYHTHLPLREYDAPLRVVDPLVLHYHGHVTRDGLLRPLGLPLVDSRITQANGLIRDGLRGHYGPYSARADSLDRSPRLS